MAWSPNGLRLAVATVDRYIILYDDNGEQKDKFTTKPGKKGQARNYIVRSLAFSPDSTKLAVAQSDDIVFIYKLGAQWGDKKTICNKFSQTSSVTSLCWPVRRANEVVFGLADGKMRIGILQQNKSATLYNTDSYVVACSAAPDGQSFVSGHLDGSIYRYTFPGDSDGPVQALLTQTNFVPYALGWGEHVCAAGNTGIVQFFDLHGQQVQQFDYSQEDNVKEFASIAFNPSGQTVVLGNFDKFFVYVFSTTTGNWEEAGTTVVENLYTVTALTWKSDGSKLVTGSLCGAVDTYDACIRRYIYRGKYEFTYTSLSSVIVKRMSSGSRMSLKSRFGLEIQKINIYSDRFLVAHTPETLMMGDLQTTHLSEVPWNGSSKEKFHFDNEAACMVFNAGELSLIEYGNNETLGSLRTEYMSPHLISLRLNEARNKEEGPVKKIAFLLDSQAVRVLDLTTDTPEATYSHDVKIDWLELNQRATKLLFRDKRRALHLYDIATQQRITLLNFCNYVQWVPDSDVVVAQSRRQLCIYYSIDNPSDVHTINIKGDVEEIERTQGRTEVIVDEGINTATYALDESLIAFGAAADGKQYEKAVRVLESLAPNAPGAEAMWQQLRKMALQDNILAISERCAAALGDISRAEFLKTLNNTMAENGNNPNHVLVRAQLALLDKQFKKAEVQLLQQGQVEAAIDMYRQLHKWEDALQVAESKSHPCVPHLKKEYFEYLIGTGQEEVAGDLKQRQGDINNALKLYLKGGFPAKAADLVMRNHELSGDNQLTDRVADALVKGKQFEKAGEFLEKLKINKRALECYCRGHAYFRAVELARIAFPGQVVSLEEEWGDYLVQQKQMDAASIHYIQAGSYLKAINAAIEAKQWHKAVQILDNLDNATAKPYYKRIAQHYSETRKYSEAEKYFIAGGLPQDAVQMYTSAGMWDQAHSIAVTYMPEQEVQSLYVTQAHLMESQGQFKEAERLYLTVNEPDLAISMYKKNRQYDDMIRLVTKHRKELLTETHIHLASQFQSEGNFKLAERHYIQAKEWKPVVSMYRENDMWEDCLRVAKSHGGQNAYKQVAYAFAVSEGGDVGVKLLAKRGLGEQAVDYAIERGEFNEAFHIAEKSCKHKLLEVHFQYAMALEDEGRFEQAEEEFIKGKKCKEAIDMYIYQCEWGAAMRVAEQHEPAGIADVQEAHGRHKAQNKDYEGAEQLFISAKKYEVAIKMYKDAKRFDDAIRLAKKFATRMVVQLQQEKLNINPGSVDGMELLLEKANLASQQGNYEQAIKHYLEVDQSHTQDADKLERAWESAVSLAMDKDVNVHKVVDEVSRRFISIRRFEEAAELLRGVDDHKGAIDAYLAGKLYPQARQYAQSTAPRLLDYVSKAQSNHYSENNDMDALSGVNPDAAIERLVQNDQWDEVFKIARTQGQDAVNKYASIQAKKLVGKGRYEAALEVFARHGAAAVPANFKLYKRIAEEVLASSEVNEVTEWASAAQVHPAVQMLRDVLFSLTEELRSTGNTDFEKLAFVAHLSVMRAKNTQAGLKSLAAKNAISLLRYTHDIAVDRAFFEAGVACQKANWTSQAFVYYNRFVDVSDMILDPDAGDIDNSDFLQTDIPSPFDVPMPQKCGYSESVREEVREWVLEKAMSSDNSAQLNTRHCEKCNKETYEAGIKCHSCSHQQEPCVVSGYPVSRHYKIHCPQCNRAANKDDYNAYVIKHHSCPWCLKQVKPSY